MAAEKTNAKEKAYGKTGVKGTAAKKTTAEKMAAGKTKADDWKTFAFWQPHLRMAALILVFGLATNALLPYIGQAQQWGYAGAFIISLVSSASIIVPTPGFIAVFEMGKVLNPATLGIAAGIGSALGELTGYWAGRQESAKVEKTRIYKENEKALRKWGPAAMFVLAAIPNPFLDFAGIAAGATGMPLWQYLLSVGAAKMLKYTLLAYTGLWSIGLV